MDPEVAEPRNEAGFPRLIRQFLEQRKGETLDPAVRRARGEHAEHALAQLVGARVLIERRERAGSREIAQNPMDGGLRQSEDAHQLRQGYAAREVRNHFEDAEIPFERCLLSLRDADALLPRAPNTLPSQDCASTPAPSIDRQRLG